jgi:hypothetical protein
VTESKCEAALTPFRANDARRGADILIDVLRSEGALRGDVHWARLSIEPVVSFVLQARLPPTEAHEGRAFGAEVRTTSELHRPILGDQF